MANFSSDYLLKGSVWNRTYFETRGKSFVRRQRGSNKEQIMSDPRFARTRENGTEFGSAARSGKLLRYAFASLVKISSDSLVTSRLTQIMTKIKNLDLESPRGERTVAIGIETEDGKALLTNFNFNDKAILTSVLSKPYNLDHATGIITIPQLTPMLNVAAPAGTTNIEFTAAIGTVDFATGKYQTEYSENMNVPYNMKAVDIKLVPTALPSGQGPTFYMLHVAFYQTVNNIQYPLNNGGYNALSIIDVK